MIRIYGRREIESGEIFRRASLSAGESVRRAVAEIVDGVRAGGDEAVLAYCEKFDGSRPVPLLVSEAEFGEAMAAADPAFLRALERAAANIREFHERQVRGGFSYTRPDGAMLGQRVLPLERVGLYIPGGTAAYPSSVLMNAIPARIAGVREIVMVSPPRKDGGVRPAVLAAARVAGVDRVYKVGGAQAIAALAWGTESIPRVDKIVGPGNAFVAEAKRQVFGQVDIDMIAGPSEILVVADGASDPRQVAADLLSQAEHGETSTAVLVCDSGALALAVQAELEKQLAVLPRQSIARASVEDNGKIIVAADLSEAVEIANEIAPEHLELCVEDPEPLLERVRNAGSVFLGRYAPEALGDYMAGPNHVLPTNGTARFSSPLSVEDFVKRSSFIRFPREALESLRDDLAVLARQEGLEGHARSVLSRFGGGEG